MGNIAGGDQPRPISGPSLKESAEDVEWAKDYAGPNAKEEAQGPDGTIHLEVVASQRREQDERAFKQQTNDSAYQFNWKATDNNNNHHNNHTPSPQQQQQQQQQQRQEAETKEDG
eukprot:TRINITY_DN6958_c0_g1_i3.p1 TRINITY_DN6958_c0_g1~~TRINITY_DN6958_c0_g1_i3.p1  ORF type:complete len:134 (+),score=54.17 TRINITY_DN6958_c0_g1_i3:58-402(+)